MASWEQQRRGLKPLPQGHSRPTPTGSGATVSLAASLIATAFTLTTSFDASVTRAAPAASLGRA
jgi:hypothetical protein